MANKKTRDERIKAEKEKKFNASRKKLVVFPIVGAVFSVIALILYSVKWAAVYNDGYGYEVQISGFNVLFAALSGKYTETAFGNMAVPFYYYAKNYCVTLGVLTIISAVVVVLTLASQIIAAITKKQLFNVTSLVGGCVSFALLLVCFSVALSMKNSDILPVYCSGNPACSIRSYAIIPAVFSLCAAGVALFEVINYEKLVKEYK